MRELAHTFSNFNGNDDNLVALRDLFLDVIDANFGVFIAPITDDISLNNEFAMTFLSDTALILIPPIYKDRFLKHANDYMHHLAEQLGIFELLKDKYLGKYQFNESTRKEMTNDIEQYIKLHEHITKSSAPEQMTDFIIERITGCKYTPINGCKFIVRNTHNERRFVI